MAFLTLIFIRIPELPKNEEEKESLFASAHGGLLWLKRNPLILKLILFLACINLIASVYDSALPAMIISKSGETSLGIVNACVGIASLLGSVLTAVIPAPSNRVRAICMALFISMCTENFFLAFGSNTVVWSVGAVLGWITIPFMNANMDVIFRKSIPAEMQGRVFSCRNTLQFFTIPLGLFLGGINVLHRLFGTGKGSGAAFLFFCIGIVGAAVCTVFWFILGKYRWKDGE